MLEFGHLTHPGRCRDLNEDTYYGNLDQGLWLVADGLGGRGFGEYASALARKAIVHSVLSGQTLEQALRCADQDIARVREHPRQPMGASVVTLHVQKTHYTMAWVGDTPAYVWQEAQLFSVRTLSARPLPHTLHPSAATATGGAGRRRRTQALGITDPAHLQIDTYQGTITPGIQWLLCSDGLSENVDPRAMAAVLQHPLYSAQECVDLLTATALENGGLDNITILLIRAHV